MHTPFPTPRRAVAISLAVALLTQASSPWALAGVVSVGTVGQSAGAGGGAAGAAVRPVSISPGLSGLSAAPGAGLRSALPSLATLKTPGTPAGIAPVAGLSAPAALSPSVGIAAPRTAAPRKAAAGLFSSRPGLSFLPANDGEGLVLERLLDEPLERPLNFSLGAKSDTSEEGGGPSAKPARSLFGSILGALRSGRFGRLFDGSKKHGRGMGILPEASASANVDLDPQPQQPTDTEVPRLTWNQVHLPGQGAQPTGTLPQGVFHQASVRPVALPGDPQDAAGVEAALRTLIRSHPGEFGGLSPDALETVVSNKVEGRAGVTDTVYVNLQQKLAGLPVEGTYLNFTIKLIRGKAILVASSAQLYPKLSIDAMGRLSEGEIIGKAFERLGRPGTPADLKRVGRRIMHVEGRWRAVSLLLSESASLMAAVDINSGEAFAWDPRMTLEAPGEEKSGRVAGRGVEFDPVNTGDNLDLMAMPHTQLKTSDGRKLYTDADGYFTLDKSKGDGPVTVTAQLKGRWAEVDDQARKDLKVQATVRPGEKIQLLFNPQGVDEGAIAQVNAYRHVNVVHDWLVNNGVNVGKVNRVLPVKTNIDRDCNAYYTRWYPSLNFFRSSNRCINTAYDTVVYHEYGHFVDDMIGGIVNGALSEGWGDILSMYITGQPITGEGFLKERTPDYIRIGTNKYQYRRGDEVHKQGQAWMGFAWKLRGKLIESFRASGLSKADAERRGAALAQALVVPVLFANVRDIPAAIEAVLMRDVGDDGRAAHFKEIQAAARAHGIEVKEPRPGEMTSSLIRGGWSAWLLRMSSRIARLFDR